MNALTRILLAFSLISTSAFLNGCATSDEMAGNLFEGMVEGGIERGFDAIGHEKHESLYDQLWEKNEEDKQAFFDKYR